ncbi:MAG: adenosylcobinamide-GDP ribazoletransferase [Desulfobacterales bacterium]|nr:adenosylcobinamide-GDP ribazoletransferase [Desulfobacterales bacterium]
MKKLIAALQFITILPLGKPVKFDPVGMIPFFPIVGLIVGGLLTLFDMGASRIWPMPVVAVLDVVLIIAITGAFHLDGLGDAADGLFSHRPKEKALEIMKDSRMGAMGLVAVICGLAIKWGGIASIHENRWLLLLLIPAYARSTMLFGIRSLPYGRPEGGTGHSLFDNKLKNSAFPGILLPIGLSFLMDWQFALWLNFIFIVITFIIIHYYKKKMGCITGDMLGAMTEASEALLFLLAPIGGFLL